MLRSVLAIMLVGVTSLTATASDPNDPNAASSATAETARSVLDFTVTTIDGQSKPLADYRGKTLLIVNVASKCGLTPQYAQLQALHDKYADRGLAILGFPANDFGRQEPGTNKQIKQFCTSRFGVAFDMFAKVVVTGEQQSELYRYLTSPKTNPKHAGPIKWNFTKFLVDGKGRVIERFEPRTKPDAPEVIQAIEQALAAATTVRDAGGKVGSAESD